MEKGIKRITTVDERFYVKPSVNTVTQLPEYKFVPSVTWITGHYPKGIAFYKWLAQKGWDESEAIKQAAGNKGSKVHSAISDLIDGKEVKMDAKYLNKDSGQEEELTLEEYECLMAFTKWFKEVKPEVIAKETVVWSDKYNYAGTIDLVCKIDGKVWIVDYKTGQYVWPEYELQLSAYRQALTEDVSMKEVATDLAILQIGYKRNKDGYKWNEIEDKFNLFLAAKAIWKNETEGEKPLQKDYPVMLSLKLDSTTGANEKEDKKVVLKELKKAGAYKASLANVKKRKSGEKRKV